MREPLAKAHNAFYKASAIEDHSCPTCIESRVSKIAETEHHHILDAMSVPTSENAPNFDAYLLDQGIKYYVNAMPKMIMTS